MAYLRPAAWCPSGMYAFLAGAVFRAAYGPHPGEHAQRHLHEQGAPHGVHDLGIWHLFVTEQTLDEGSAGAASARAHAGPCHSLDLVHVAIALADQRPDLPRRDALAATDYCVVSQAGRHDVMVHGLGD